MAIPYMVGLVKVSITKTACNQDRILFQAVFYVCTYSYAYTHFIVSGFPNTEKTCRLTPVLSLESYS